ESNITEGICCLFVPHSTAGIAINENADPSVKVDIAYKLNSLVPAHDRYSHTEGNADSHIKSVIVGPSVTVIIENKRLLLGTWQGIYFCEFDGPRNRKVYVKLIKS
ncbi:MAG: YjbQ family protein, partial [Actinobacteria bacterium]|nr:YjbQ family protein [Actinomycetota bacterium]